MVPLTIILAAIGGLLVYWGWDRLLEDGGRRNALSSAALAVLVAGVVGYLFTTTAAVSGPMAWLLAVVVYTSAMLTWTRGKGSQTERGRSQLLGRVPKDEAGRAAWIKAMDELQEQEMQDLRPHVPTRRDAAKKFARVVTARLASVRELRDPRTGQFTTAFGKTASEWEGEERRLDAERQWCSRYLRK